MKAIKIVPAALVAALFLAGCGGARTPAPGAALSFEDAKSDAGRRGGLVLAEFFSET